MAIEGMRAVRHSSTGGFDVAMGGKEVDCKTMGGTSLSKSTLTFLIHPFGIFLRLRHFKLIT